MPPIILSLLLLVASAAPTPALAQTVPVEYISYDAAKPVLQDFADNLLPELAWACGPPIKMKILGGPRTLEPHRSSQMVLDVAPKWPDFRRS